MRGNEDKCQSGPGRRRKVVWGNVQWALSRPMQVLQITEVDVVEHNCCGPEYKYGALDTWMMHCLHTTSIPNNLCWDIPWLLLKSSLVMLLLYWIIAPKSFFNKKMQQMYKLSLSSWLPLAIYTKIATSESAKEREDSLRWNVSKVGAWFQCTCAMSTCTCCMWI